MQITCNNTKFSVSKSHEELTAALRFQLIQTLTLVGLHNYNALLGKLLQDRFCAAQAGVQGFGECEQVAGGVVCEIVNEQLANQKAAYAATLILPVEGKMLDNQQMRCITKEVRNHLVLAGAGTGKTGRA